MNWGRGGGQMELRCNSVFLCIVRQQWINNSLKRYCPSPARLLTGILQPLLRSRQTWHLQSVPSSLFIRRRRSSGSVRSPRKLKKKQKTVCIYQSPRGTRSDASGGGNLKSIAKGFFGRSPQPRQGSAPPVLPSRRGRWDFFVQKQI